MGGPSNDPDAISVQEPVLAAAATEPLIDRNDEFVFDADAFFAAVLQHAEEEGKA
jgi:hypothetical protein